jgi:hypothetical protein
LATQQSIKAYVDAQVGANNELSEILANGNTSGGNDIQMTTTDEVQFRDTALKISSSVDGQLDIAADVELEIVAPTLDINASTAVTIDTTTMTMTGSVNVVGDLDVDNLNINGNSIISTNTDGNIALTPNGTGEVDISKVDINGGTIDGTVIGGSTPAAISGTTGSFSGDVSIADKIVHTGDTDTAIRFPAADKVAFETAGVERFNITSGGINLPTPASGNANISFDGSTFTLVSNSTGASMVLSTNSAERTRIDNVGTLIHKLAATFNEDGADADFRVESDNNTHALFVDAGNSTVNINSLNSVISWTTNRRMDVSINPSNAIYPGFAAYAYTTTATAGGAVVLGHSRSTTGGVATETQANDTLGFLSFEGVNASNSFVSGAYISSVQEGSAGATGIPGSLRFFTGTSGAVPAQRMSISSAGVLTNQIGAVFNESGADSDFRVESDANANMLFVDASANRVGVGKSSLNYTLDVEGSIASAHYLRVDSNSGVAGSSLLTLKRSGNDTGDYLQMRDGSNNLFATFDEGGIIFNETGGDTDFRVESDTNTHAIFVDAGANRVGFFDTSELLSTVEMVTGDGTFGDSGNLLSIKAAAGNLVDKLNIGVSSTSGYGFIQATKPGADVRPLLIQPSGGGTIFNETGVDADFRVESDGNANMLFVDASVNRVGIGTNAPDVEFHLNGQNLLIDNDNGTLFIGTGTISYGGCIGIGRAGEAGFHIGSSQVGDLCIGAEVNTNIRFGTNTSGALSTRMTIAPNGDVNVVGAFSKGSGSFRIDHPLPEKRDTHHLVHSFVEAPQADNIYRGKVELVGGTATVNIDTIAGMTEGTFVALNREIQCFTSNETGWTAVRGSVRGNTLTIEAQDNTCTDTISWLVIGERQDQHMYDTDWTDDNGKVIVEPLKPVEK